MFLSGQLGIDLLRLIIVHLMGDVAAEEFCKKTQKEFDAMTILKNWNVNLVRALDVVTKRRSKNYLFVDEPYLRNFEQMLHNVNLTAKKLGPRELGKLDFSKMYFIAAQRYVNRRCPSAWEMFCCLKDGACCSRRHHIVQSCTFCNATDRKLLVFNLGMFYPQQFLGTHIQRLQSLNYPCFVECWLRISEKNIATETVLEVMFADAPADSYIPKFLIHELKYHFSVFWEEHSGLTKSSQTIYQTNLERKFIYKHQALSFIKQFDKKYVLGDNKYQAVQSGLDEVFFENLQNVYINLWFEDPVRVLYEAESWGHKF